MCSDYLGWSRTPSFAGPSSIERLRVGYIPAAENNSDQGAPGMKVFLPVDTESVVPYVWDIPQQFSCRIVKISEFQVRVEIPLVWHSPIKASIAEFFGSLRSQK